MLHRENESENRAQILFLTKSQDMPRKVIATTQDVVQRQYKDAELILCEFMAVQEYDMEEWDPPTYSDFNLQDFHDFVADKIEAFDPFNNNRYPWWKRWPYQTKKE